MALNLRGVLPWLVIDLGLVEVRWYSWPLFITMLVLCGIML